MAATRILSRRLAVLVAVTLALAGALLTGPVGFATGPSHLVPRAGAGANSTATFLFLAETLTVDANSFNFKNFLVDGTPTDASLVVTIAEDGSPMYGTLIVGGNGSGNGVRNFRYTPTPGYVGPDAFTLRVTNPAGDYAEQTVGVTIVNPPPVAIAQSVSTDEDTGVGITLAGTDIGTPVTSLTHTVVDGPTRGTLSGVAPNLTYTPTANLNGLDSFTFRVNDGTLDSDLATVTISVTAVNDAPIVSPNPISATTDEDTPVIIPIGATDDGGADRLTYRYVPGSGPNHGDISGDISSADPRVAYTPDENFHGKDQLAIEVDDGVNPPVVAVVVIEVMSVNDAPVFIDGDRVTLTVIEDGPQVEIPLPATDVDGNKLELDAVAPNPTRASRYGVRNRPLVTYYQPAVNASGTDQYGVEVYDTDGGIDTILVDVVITPVNDAPVATDDDLPASDEDVVRTIPVADLTANDTAGPNEADQGLTISAVGDATGGTVAIVGTDVVFTPTANVSGPAGFTYTVSDDGTPPLTDTATVTFTLTAVNDPPVFTADPADIGPVEATGPGGANVTFPNPVVIDPDGVGPEVLCIPGSGGLFALGETIVTCTAFADDMIAMVDFIVTVVDTTDPVLTVPADITAEATSPAGASVPFTVSATDLVDGTVPVVCRVGSTVFISPGPFPNGTTTVNCTATDAAGNAATASFTVSVRDTTGPGITWVGGPQPNRSYTRSALPGEPTCTATDAASTVTQCRVYGYSTAIGTHTLTARARDTEGNSSVSTWTYTVTAGPAPSSTPVLPRPTATPTRPPVPTVRPTQPTVPAASPTRAPRPTTAPIAPTATPTVAPTIAPTTAPPPSSTRPPRR